MAVEEWGLGIYTDYCRIERKVARLPYWQQRYQYFVTAAA